MNNCYLIIIVIAIGMLLLHHCYAINQDLFKIHKEILAEVSKAVDRDQPQDVARIFIKSKKRLVLYADYCSGLPAAQAKVDELMKRNDVIKHSIAVSDGVTKQQLDMSHASTQRVVV